MAATKPPLIGIYGGTFDPIHYAHLRVAEELLDRVGFDQFYFVPTGEPRLRQAPVASKFHRKTMTQLAIRDHEKFVLDDREINRLGVTTTVESLREYRAEVGNHAALCFIMGADTFVKIHQWHCWLELFQLCHLIVIGRPGYTHVLSGQGLEQELQDACCTRWVTNANQLACQISGLILTIQMPLLEISATTIRGLIASEKSARFLLPEIVYDYIKMNHLYAETDDQRF